MATPTENPSTETPSTNRNNLPLIAVAAVVVIGLVLYFIGRGSNTGGKSGDAPQPASLPEGRGASMARNTGKTIALSAPRVTKIPAGGELGAGQTGWAFDIAYTWKEEIDPKMSFRAPYKMPKPNERGGIALPGKDAPRPASSPVPQATQGAGKTENGGKTGNIATNSAAPPASGGPASGQSGDPMFLLPRKSGRIRLLIPNNPELQAKKGDKISVQFQALLSGWTIPASNEITLPPLP